MKKELKGKWVNFDEIASYEDQIKSLLYETVVKFHYPDWNIDESYAEERFMKLKKFLSENKAYVWCIVDNDMVVCMYWCYIIPFLNKKRWRIADFIINSKYRNMGIGRMALQAGEKKARELGCDDMGLMYVPWNKNAAHLYESEGYKIARIEAVKKI